MKHNNRKTIGLLIQDLGFRLYLGAAQAARKCNVNLFCYLGNSVNRHDTEEEPANIVYDLVDTQMIDSLAIWGGSGAGVGINLNREEMSEFINHFSPLPIVNYERKIENFPVILTDVYQGMCEAVRHLIEVHHCQHIALIWGPECHFETEERVRAYRDTLAEYNMPVDSRIVSEPVDWTPVGGEQAMEELLIGKGLVPGNDFDAIITTDSAQAVGVLNILHQNSIHIPGDVLVLGFDEREDSRLTIPPLTTVMKPFFDVGKRLVEMASEMTAGKKIADQTNIPTRLVIRRSCGCIDPVITQAALEKTRASQEKFDIIINTRRASFQNEIANGMEAAVPHSDHFMILQMVEAFINELTGEETGGFSTVLEKFLDIESLKSNLADGLSGKILDGSTWQNMISSMQRGMLPHLDGKKRALAESLWNQARVSIGETAQRMQAYHRYINNQKQQTLQRIEADLSHALNRESLINILAESLPQLDFHSGFLSLYENLKPNSYPNTTPEWSRLVLAFNDSGRIDIPNEGLRFPSKKLIPEDMLPVDRPRCYLVIPLFFIHKQQGFLMLEIGPQDEKIYRSLQVHISRALYSEDLVNRLDERYTRLEAVEQVSHAATRIFKLDELLQQAVELIHKHFNLYFTGVFLVDEEGGYARLQAGTGEAGTQMLNQDHKLEINDTSVIGSCITNASTYVYPDTADETSNRELSISENTPINFHPSIKRHRNPLLPDTCSEMALPLINLGLVLGALSIQSIDQNAFSEEDILFFQSMADQLANAIANARLYKKMQATLREIEIINHRNLVQDWEEFTHNRSVSGYKINNNEITPLGDNLYPEVQKTVTEENTISEKSNIKGRNKLTIPIKLRDLTIGAIGLQCENEQHQWSDEEISLIEILSEQFALAAENIRLLEETQRRAEREHLVSEITTKIRLSNDPQTILETAVSELRRTFHAKNARVLIASDEKLTR